MALSAGEHRASQRAAKDARNGAARYGLAQRRGRELAALRREVSELRVFKSRVRWLLSQPHESIAAEDMRALRNALGLDE
jgi:hypothetical protein